MKSTKFVVKESNFSARVKTRWRFPRGKHSKVRQMHKGRPALPSPGFGSPKDKKGLINGLLPKVVSTLADLENVSEKEGVIIAGKLGLRKKVLLLKKAEEKKLQVLNIKDIKEFIKKSEDSITARKKVRKDKQSRKAKKAEEKKKEDKKEEKSVDEKVEEQKKIVEKTLTKKQ